MKSNYKTARGFTLIEILVVIGIIAVLATIVIIAINPARQFAQANNTQRQANTNAILNAIGQRMADNKGVFAGTFAGSNTCGPLPVATSSITTSMAGDTTTETGALGCLVPTYIPALPTDPTGAVGVDTGYEVVRDAATGRIKIIAPDTQPPATSDIEVIR